MHASRCDRRGPAGKVPRRTWRDVARGVDTPMTGRATATGASRQRAPTRSGGRGGSGGDVRGRGGRFWVRTSASLSMRGPSSANPVSAAAATSTLAARPFTAVLRRLRACCRTAETVPGLSHRSLRSISRNAWSSWSLSTAHLRKSPNAVGAPRPGPGGGGLCRRIAGAGAPAVRGGAPQPPARRSPTVRRRSKNRPGLGCFHHGRVRPGGVGVGRNHQQDQPAELLPITDMCWSTWSLEPSRMTLWPLNSIRNDCGSQLVSS